MKTALVLSGGGGKGGYQLGVWQALNEMNIQIDIVTGTSVGALNGVFYAQGAYKIANEVWRKLTPATILSVKNIDDSKLAERELFMRAFVGGTDANPLEKMVKELLDEEYVRNSPCRYGLVTVAIPSLKPLCLPIEKIPQGELADYVMASVSAFPMFKPKEIDGQKYIDGGYYDNKPINLAIDMGAKKIICVDLLAPGVNNRRPKKKVETITISPRRQPGGIMRFDAQIVDEYSYIGYSDALKAFNKAFGEKFCFRVEEAKEKITKIQVEFSSILKKIVSDNKIDLLTQAKLKILFSKFDDDFTSLHQRGIIVRLMEEGGVRFGIEDDHIYTVDEFNAELSQKVQALIIKQKIEVKPKRLILLDNDDNIAYIYLVIKKYLETGENQEEVFSLLRLKTIISMIATYIVASEVV